MPSRGSLTRIVMNRLFITQRLVFLLGGFVLVLLAGGCASMLGTPRTDRLIEARLDETIPQLDPLVEAPLVTGATQLTIQVEQAVALALKHNRTLKNLRSVLDENVLDFLRVERRFGWQPDGTLNAEKTLGEDDEQGNLDLTLDRVLYTGGELALNFGSTQNPEDYNNRATARIEQPVLRGRGYTFSHEELIAARRSLLYQTRFFALEREELLLEIFEGYFDLVQQKQVLENLRQNAEQFRFLREKTEKVFPVQKASYLDVLRAQQQETTANNSLANAEVNYQIALKQYLLRLGLPLHLKLNLSPTIPGLQKLQADEATLIELAQAFRLDVLSDRMQVEDAERELKLARNRMVPSLDLFAQATATESGEGTVELSEPDDEYQVGLTLDLPVDLRGERDLLMLAELNLETARRSLVNSELSIQLETLDRLNDLANFERNLIAQQLNLNLAEKQVKNAIIRFENGELSNRDVVEAQNALLDAKNGVSQALISHEVERVKLLSTLGVLQIDRDGKLVARDLGDRIPGKLFHPRQNLEESVPE